MSGDAVRLLVLWCPDWPVVAAGAAAGTPPLAPAAVFSTNRVVTCSAAARRSGIGRGLRRRDAQSRCPELVVHQHDPDRDARLFEPVAAAVERHAVGIEVVRPGIVAVPVAGAAGYFGGQEALAELLVTEVEAHAGVECQVGIADGLFAATLAARRAIFVPPGGAAGFLTPLPVADLDQPGEERGELVGLLQRLGLRTLAPSPPSPNARSLAGFRGTRSPRTGSPEASHSGRRCSARSHRTWRSPRPSSIRWSGSTRPRSSRRPSVSGSSPDSPSTGSPAPG
ncbi:DNA polymerase Y family protein [Amycolatopsis sp. NPDC003861]